MSVRPVPTPPKFGRCEIIYDGVIHSRGRPPIPCLVRDLKAKGARILVQFTPPPSFELIVEVTGLDAHCQVVARTMEGVEVAFV
jgi:hypothetical protein